MTTGEAVPRPGILKWGYRCWVISGVLLVGAGSWAVAAGFVEAGAVFGPVAFGVVAIVVGAAYVLLGYKAYHGDARWRSALSALTLVMTGMMLFIAIGFGSPGYAIVLAVAVIGLLGSLLAYRPASEDWFARQPVNASEGDLGV